MKESEEENLFSRIWLNQQFEFLMLFYVIDLYKQEAAAAS